MRYGGDVRTIPIQGFVYLSRLWDDDDDGDDGVFTTLSY